MKTDIFFIFVVCYVFRFLWYICKIKLFFFFACSTYGQMMAW